jgi:pimeloyl-ACP methyl ester carboxylesterase
LWAEDGNQESDTVLLICQGGPSKNLTFIEKGRTSYRYIPNYANYHIAYLHQAQTLNKKLFEYNGEYTFEMAAKEVDNTSEILYRALHYFKTKGKTTLVIGTSYGAYIIPHYLSTRPSLANKYIIVAGRLDDNKQMLEQHLKGFNGEFKEDGVTYVPADENADFSDYSESEIKEYRVKQLLKAAIGKPRYTQELADKDLSNVIYFYATNDQHVGRLTESEIAFLTSKKAKLVETNSGHSETLYRFIDQLMDGSLKL